MAKALKEKGGLDNRNWKIMPLNKPPRNQGKTGYHADLGFTAYYALGVAYPKHADHMYSVFQRADYLLNHKCLKHLNSLSAKAYLCALEFVYLWVSKESLDLSLVIERVCQLMGDTLMITNLIDFQKRFSAANMVRLHAPEMIELLDDLEARRQDAYKVIQSSSSVANMVTKAKSASRVKQVNTMGDPALQKWVDDAIAGKKASFAEMYNIV